MSAHGPAHAAASDVANLLRGHEVDGLLVIAQRIRAERCWPMFRIGVDDEGRVTFATSREHEDGTRSRTLKEAIAKWITIAERVPAYEPDARVRP